MFTPVVWLRRRWLAKAMLGYPVYDPPHRSEERLLSREDAIQNFNYFMQHKDDRTTHFRKWLKKYFGINITDDQMGFRNLNSWAVSYSGLLYPMGGSPDPFIDYNTYWEGDFIGCNVLYDFGITVGQLTILNCPGLSWAFDPTAELLPKTAAMLRREWGSGFQQPYLIGGRNPAWSYAPIHNAGQFALRMMRIQTNPKSRAKFRHEPKRMKAMTLNLLVNQFQSAMNYVSASYEDKLRFSKMSDEEYLNFVDSDTVRDEEC